MTIDELLSTEEAARVAGTTRGTIGRAIREGRLSARRVGRYWAVRRADLDKWIAAGGYHPEKVRLDRRK